MPKINLYKELKALEQSGLALDEFASPMRTVIEPSDELLHARYHDARISVSDHYVTHVDLRDPLPANICTSCGVFDTEDHRLAFAIELRTYAQKLSELTPIKDASDALEVIKIVRFALSLSRRKLTGEHSAAFDAWKESHFELVRSIKSEAQGYLRSDADAQRQARISIISSDYRYLQNKFDQQADLVSAARQLVGYEILNNLVRGWSAVMLWNPRLKEERLEVVMKIFMERVQLREVKIEQLLDDVSVERDADESLKDWLKRVYIEQVHALISKIDDLFYAAVIERLDYDPEIYYVYVKSRDAAEWSVKSGHFETLLANGVESKSENILTPVIGEASLTLFDAGMTTALGEGADLRRTLETFEVLINDQPTGNWNSLLDTAISLEK